MDINTHSYINMFNNILVYLHHSKADIEDIISIQHVILMDINTHSYVNMLNNILRIYLHHSSADIEDITAARGLHCVFILYDKTHF